VTRSYLLLIGAAVVWALQPAFIKWLTAEMLPLTFTALRHTVIAGVLLVVYYLRERHRFWPLGREWLLFALMGATGILINNAVQFTGLKYTTMTNCALISAMAPTFTALLAALFLRERLAGRAWLGIVLSLVGVTVIISQGSWELIQSLSLNYGDVLCIVAILGWAVFSLLGVEVMKRHSAVGATAWSSLFGAVLTCLYGMAVGEFQPVALSPLAFSCAAYATLLGGIFCVLAWNYGVQAVGASTAAVFLNLMPVVGMVGGVILLGELITTASVAGAVLVISGVWLTTHAR